MAHNVLEAVRVPQVKFPAESAQEVAIRDRVSEMPKSCVKTYLAAMKGRSARSAIRAFCHMCMGWADYRAGIRRCSDPACPLYPYRPYRD